MVANAGREIAAGPTVVTARVISSPGPAGKSVIGKTELAVTLSAIVSPPGPEKLSR